MYGSNDVPYKTCFSWMLSVFGRVKSLDILIYSSPRFVVICLRGKGKSKCQRQLALVAHHWVNCSRRRRKCHRNHSSLNETLRETGWNLCSVSWLEVTEGNNQQGWSADVLRDLAVLTNVGVLVHFVSTHTLHRIVWPRPTLGRERIFLLGIF